MDTFKEFLEYSSINGMSLISNTRRFSRLFWILIVLGGFVCATYLIFESFDNWKEKPITTTIETLPISELTLPNVTVCPPRGLFLNLNHDIKESENITLNKDLRKELLDYALDVILDQYYNEAMANLSKIQDPDRYYNWYHGYTFLRYPHYNYKVNQLKYYVDTAAASGNMTTPYFSDNFNADKVDGNIFIQIRIHVPPSVSGNRSTTLLLNLEKNSVKALRDKHYKENIKEYMHMSTIGNINFDKTHVSKNITGPTSDRYDIRLNRKITDEDMNNIKGDKMPGFRLIWSFNKNIESGAKYKLDNTQFTRLVFPNF